MDTTMRPIARENPPLCAPFSDLSSLLHPRGWKERPWERGKRIIFRLLEHENENGRGGLRRKDGGYETLNLHILGPPSRYTRFQQLLSSSAFVPSFPNKLKNSYNFLPFTPIRRLEARLRVVP
eukprot:893457-Amorphochlora_amoeboformis.AAC.1